MKSGPIRLSAYSEGWDDRGLSFRIEDLELVDFKVRILDGGTGAVTRVLIESRDGTSTWGTCGVSENIIEASWRALADSMEYGLMVAH